MSIKQNRFAEAKVEMELRKKQMTRKKIKGDGHCLFRALAHIFKKDEEKHLEVRNELIAYMENQGNLEDIKEALK